MKVGDRVRTLHSDPSVAVHGTVKEVRESHVSVQWDGWSSPRWIQTRGLESLRKKRSRNSRRKSSLR
jgi:hypothetical protein